MNSEAKTPQPGEWHGRGKSRVFICGRTDDGDLIWRFHPNGDLYFNTLDWSGWEHLPDCTGWEWQPSPPQASPPQKWFDLTPMDDHVLRLNIDEVRHGGEWCFFAKSFEIRIRDAKKRWPGWEFRCRIEDAPHPGDTPTGRTETREVPR